jgi:hypothetical protein
VRPLETSHKTRTEEGFYGVETALETPPPYHSKYTVIEETKGVFGPIFVPQLSGGINFRQEGGLAEREHQGTTRCRFSIKTEHENVVLH